MYMAATLIVLPDTIIYMEITYSGHSLPDTGMYMATTSLIVLCLIQ